MTGYTDNFVIVNGPEDGTEFPISRTPVYIGSGPDCAVQLRLDQSAAEHHAYVTVVSDGYRVRRSDSAPVYVNNVRVGKIRSIIAHTGDTIRVGQTLIAVDCVPEGLASRSQGIVTESDFVYALRGALGGAAGAGAGAIGSGVGFLGGGFLGLVKGILNLLLNIISGLATKLWFWLLIAGLIVACSPRAQLWGKYYIELLIYKVRMMTGQ